LLSTDEFTNTSWYPRAGAEIAAHLDGPIEGMRERTAGFVNSMSKTLIS